MKFAEFGTLLAKDLFQYSQWAMLGGIILAIFIYRKGWNTSGGFRSHGQPRDQSHNPLALPNEEPKKRPNSSKDPKPESLQLEGIRIDGAPHEILGVTPDAPTKEIRTAYRKLMKQYHPDSVGRPGSREWKDAQKIAEAINRAKSQMLSSRQSHNPRRSGR